MKKNIKLSLFWVLILAFLMASKPTLAMDISTEAMALSLNKLDLFRGTNQGFELDEPCDRLMAAVLMTRFLGQEDYALNQKFTHPFDDISGNYAEDYIAYLYSQDLVRGIDYNSYGLSNMSGNQFATLILRVLGYQDNIDFSWDNALQTMVDLAIIPAEDLNDLNIAGISRGQAVYLCYQAMQANLKNSDIRLAQQLLAQDVYSTQQLAQTQDATLLIAADMPDHMGYTVNIYQLNQFSDIINLAIINRQNNLSLYAPTIEESQATEIINHILEPYIEREVAIQFAYTAANHKYDIFINIADYISMEFYYQNPERYQKNHQVYSDLAANTEDSYISLGEWAQKIEQILSQIILPDMNQTEQAKAIFDYLIINTVYDQTANDYSLAHYPQSVLFDGLGVCDGYSAAFKMLLNAQGIESNVIFGLADNVEHSWNQVKIDDNWYNFDITFSETLSGTNLINYSYFGMPDSQFYLNHIPHDLNQVNPAANSYLIINAPQDTIDNTSQK